MTGQQEKAMKSKEYKTKYLRTNSTNPIHIVLDKIKSQINNFKKFGKTPITGMGGHQMKDSDRFNDFESGDLL
jgi:hypothetical protein|tara:strand:- start:296 stop:514 length:219 start_codon:yes stop_codon:yes gene_type:complete